MQTHSARVGDVFCKLAESTEVLLPYLSSALDFNKQCLLATAFDDEVNLRVVLGAQVRQLKLLARIVEPRTNHTDDESLQSLAQKIELLTTQHRLGSQEKYAKTVPKRSIVFTLEIGDG